MQQSAAERGPGSISTASQSPGLALGPAAAAAADSVHTDTAQVPDADILLHLPQDIFADHVIVPYLSVRDKQALRQSSRLGRCLANASVRGCVLDAYSDNTQVQQQVPSSFCNLRTLKIVCTPPAVAAAAAGPTNSSTGSSDCIASLQEQLPAVLHQLSCLSHLVYEGPRNRRQQGLNMTGPLQALTRSTHMPAAAAPPAPPAAAAAAATAAGTPAAALSGAAAGPATGQTAGQAAQAAGAAGVPAAVCGLRVLELTSGCLPDALMESVGNCVGLVELKLNATASIHMGPVAHLKQLTRVTLTVTAPLHAALWPLSSLTRLSHLSLSALSPARGWGTALARLAPGCPLAHLDLAFADVADADMATLAAAHSGLTHLNLNYSRHLSPASVPHLATLQSLSALHLQETGLTLGPSELELLGRGCPHLATLQAAFDLRPLTLPDWATNRDRPFAAWVAQIRAAHPALNIQVGAADPSVGVNPSNSSSSSSSTRHWPSLRKLLLNGVSVSDFDKLLHGFSQLTCLVLDNMGPNGNQMLLDLTTHCTAPPPLQELVLSAGGPVSEDAAKGLAASLQGLTAVSFSSMKLTPGQGGALLGALLPHAATLQSLSLHRFVWLSDRHLAAVVRRLTGLRRLELCKCDRVAGEGVTQQGLVALAGHLPQLTQLVVRECQGLGVEVGRAWECAVAAARAAAAEAAGSGGVEGLPVSWAARQEVVVEPCAAADGSPAPAAAAAAQAAAQHT